MIKKVMNRTSENKEMFFLAIVYNKLALVKHKAKLSQIDIIWAIANEWHDIYNRKIVNYVVNVEDYIKSFRFRFQFLKGVNFHI